MKPRSPEKQGAIMLIRLWIWLMALICFWFGAKGIYSQGFWGRGTSFGKMTMPPEGFLFFGLLLLLFDWLVRRGKIDS